MAWRCVCWSVAEKQMGVDRGRRRLQANTKRLTLGSMFRLLSESHGLLMQRFSRGCIARTPYSKPLSTSRSLANRLLCKCSWYLHSFGSKTHVFANYKETGSAIGWKIIAALQTICISWMWTLHTWDHSIRTIPQAVTLGMLLFRLARLGRHTRLGTCSCQSGWLFET